MKKTIVILASLILLAGTACKKHTSAPTQRTITPPPTTTSTNTVECTMQWVYSNAQPENQMYYTVNNGPHIILSTSTAVDYQTSAASTIAEVLLYSNIGDVITIYGPPLGSIGYNKFTINETNDAFTTSTTNGTVTGTVPSGGSDMEYTTQAGATTFSFTMH